jgi:6-phosphogluconate dehydrogenase (decarboxylating)
MQLGMIGLGRMGAAMVRRLMRGGHDCVVSAALYERFSSRGEADFADRILSAMRYGFGGHLEKVDNKLGGER